MKFRIEKDTVKFRLTPSEIDMLKANKSITNSISFGLENGFTYTIKPSDDLEQLSLKFKAQGVLVLVPVRLLNNWFSSNDIGIKESLDNKGKEVSIVIEEDLPPRKAKKRLA